MACGIGVQTGGGLLIENINERIGCRLIFTLSEYSTFKVDKRPFKSFTSGAGYRTIQCSRRGKKPALVEGGDGQDGEPKRRRGYVADF